jgi:hypothetical protein
MGEEKLRSLLGRASLGNHLKVYSAISEPRAHSVGWYNRQRLSRMTLYSLLGADRCSWERLAYPGAPDKSVFAPRADKTEIVNGGFD